MRSEEHSREPGAQGPSFLLLTLAVGLAASVIFVGFPQIDIAVSRLFFLGDREFWLTGSAGLGAFLRNSFKLTFLLASICASIGLLVSIFFRKRLSGLGFPQWLCLVMVLIVGPGLIANSLLKDHWDRARPRYIEQFGGNEHFTPALERSNQCEKNCSFVAGEAASIYALGFALAFVVGGRRRRALLIALAVGSFVGLVRIAGGGHFFSDVVFAGVFMGLVVRGMYWIVFERFETELADGGPLHTRLNSVAIWLRNAVRRLLGRAPLAQAGAASSQWVQTQSKRGSDSISRLAARFKRPPQL
ncbi:phosphatase PAP2 family protein [Methyloligella sp. 2.7D]|uniref:phosphatase PAP2 family protein n=1 Tax=unclassified Methyloligella TaxID=2625955 RepID=UPI00157D3BAA|nr:phosphatase PAP2 family protein [Methyloligella sp. GL2]QKP76612.1 phosphatase PAP2 family protein [Methyloligella sp. GL2]